MNIKQLKAAICDMPDEWEVYFRRVAPVLGNVELAGSIKADDVQFFGKIEPCAVIEPCGEDEE